jgi:hypothetical protein
MPRLPMRTRLETLRLEFPFHAISMQTIGDKMFYLAEATSTQVQPCFAQAESTDRLRAKLATPVREFTTTEPSIPRVWDALLGGKDNFAVDREQAAKLLSVFPQAGQLARESREFQRRAVTLVATAGVRQFLDIGCGLPTTPATHEVAQQVQPGSVVVYVDNDELVMSHAQNLLARAPGVLAVAGDLAHTDEILCDWRVRQVIDFRQPIAVVLTMTLHFFDPETVHSICARFIEEIAPGSYLIVSAGCLEGATGEQFTAKYHAGSLHHYTREDIMGFLDGVEFIRPGLTDARAWLAPTLLTGQQLKGHVWAAIAQKPKLGTSVVSRD